MATKLYASGEVIQYVNSGSAIASGAVVVTGQYVGVAVTDIANGATGSVAIDGVYTLAKATGTAYVQGDALYWDTGNSRCTKTVTDTPIGIAYKAATSGATECQVQLNQSFVGQTEALAALADGLTPTQIAAVASNAAVPIVWKFDCSAASASITLFNAAVPYDCEIIDVAVQCTAANASGTLKLTDGTNDITNAIACVTDKAIARAGTIDDAYSTLTAGDSLVAVKNAAADSGTVYITVLKV